MIARVTYWASVRWKVSPQGVLGACVNFSIQGQKNGEIKRRWGARDAREYLWQLLTFNHKNCVSFY